MGCCSSEQDNDVDGMHFDRKTGWTKRAYEGENSQNEERKNTTSLAVTMNNSKLNPSL